MDIQLQPRNSKTCGHHCVAMVAGVPVAEVIKLIGHEHGTRATELAKALSSYGFTTSTRLEHIRKDTKLPRLCILRFYYQDCDHSHWVVYNNGEILDPGCGEYYFTPAMMYRMRARATSYLAIFKK